MAKKTAVVIGIIFLIVGVLGFVSNPLVGEGALFETNTAHDWVHIVAGLILVIAGASGAGAAATTMKVLGVIYLIVAVLGFIAGEGSVLGFIEVNAADNWLHVVLGIVLLGLGIKAGKGEGISQTV